MGRSVSLWIFLCLSVFLKPFPRTPTPIVDKHGVTIGILARRAEDAEWPLLHLQACELLNSCRTMCTPRKGKQRVHCRGAFIALRCGVSHGGGQPQPQNLENTPADARVLEELNSHPFFKRIAGFATGMSSGA